MKKTKEPTGYATWTHYCHAPLELKHPEWDDLPAKAKREFTVGGPVPCQGGFMPGSWCENCRFGGRSINVKHEIDRPNE